MAKQFAAGKKALGVCDVCGFVYNLRELRNVYRKKKDTNIKACSSCWDADHPQLQTENLVTLVNDPQAIRNPRPDFAGYAQSRAQIIPVYTMVTAASAGRVTVDEG